MGRVQLADLSDVQVKELFIILCVEILAVMCCWLAGFQERRPLPCVHPVTTQCAT